MEKHSDPMMSLGSQIMGRREFIKWAGALGLSVSAVEALLSQQETAFAASTELMMCAYTIGF
ncbi:MAG TPA: hypothetical protein DHW02_02070 [Ktedonobacter sp.]|nr:hypothetical protein [Ktedonobacter sp.]